MGHRGMATMATIRQVQHLTETDMENREYEKPEGGLTCQCAQMPPGQKCTECAVEAVAEWKRKKSLVPTKSRKSGTVAAS